MELTGTDHNHNGNLGSSDYQSFFDNGGTGLGLQILASLGRVAIGFSLSAIVDCAGIMIGINPDLSRCRPDLPSAAYRAASLAAPFSSGVSTIQSSAIL